MQEDEKIEEYIKEEDFKEKGKEGWRERLNNFLNSGYFIPIIIILIAAIAFSLGRISGLQEKREPVRVIDNSITASENNPPNPPYIKGEIETKNPTSNFEQTAAVGASSGQTQPSQGVTAGAVVASKNGTKYHYPWCAGAKQISEKNKISFTSIEEARKAGYTPASNCKGLK